jgi:hypothetical protein
MKICLLQECTYHQIELKFKNQLKLDIHEQIHANANGRRSCMTRWISAKTMSFVFLHKTKQIDVLMKLHVLVMSMLAHGRRDICYASYNLDQYVHDSNYMLSFFKI